MRRAAPLTAVVAAALALAAATPAAAAEWRIVPTVGARGGGSVDVPGVGDDGLDTGVVFGVTVNRAIKPETALELTWLRHDTGFDVRGETPGGVPGPFGLTVDTLQVGGTYSPLRKGRTRPFVATTVGLHWYDPEPASFGGEAQLSMAVSGGFEMRLSARTALRLTARGWFLLQSVSLSGACGGTSCTVHVSGSGGFQVDGTVGLAIDL